MESRSENAVRQPGGTDYRFKILYAVGMLMVVCYHSDGGGIALTRDWFLLGGLHMALFAFCSGYFYKTSSEEHPLRYIGKKAKRLLVPLYLYHFAYGALVWLSRKKGFTIGEDPTLYNLFVSPVTNGHAFVYNLGSWFMVPLFMAEAYNVLLRKLLRKLPGGPAPQAQAPENEKTECLIYALHFAAGVIGNQLICTGHNQGLMLVLVRMLYFLPFFGLGTFYRAVLEPFDRRIPDFWYIAVNFALKLLIVWYFGRTLIYTPSTCDDFTEGPLMPIVIAYLGIALWVRLAAILEPAIGRSRAVNLVADSSYSIAVNEFLGFMAVKTVFALMSRVSASFADFSWEAYKSDIWYYYKPRGLSDTLILYAAAGIILPVFIQKGIDRLKSAGKGGKTSERT